MSVTTRTRRTTRRKPQKPAGAPKRGGAAQGRRGGRSSQGRQAAATGQAAPASAGHQQQALSLRAYARHRDVSHQAVMRAVASGRLRASLAYVDDRPQIADVAAADREWAANTDLSRAPDHVKAHAAGGGNDTSSHVSTRLEPQAHGGALKRTSAGGADDGGEGELLLDGLPAQSLASASAREKHFRAKLAELTYRERAGELVDAQQIQAQLVDAITTCRTKLLGIPSKAKQRLPHLTLDDLTTVDTIVREALEELVPAAPTQEGPDVSRQHP